MRFLYILLLFFPAMSDVSFAQLKGQAKIDSLLKELPKMTDDTNAVNLLANLSFEYYVIEPDEGIRYGEEGLRIAKKNQWKIGVARCYNLLGINYQQKSDFKKALEYYHKSLDVNIDIGLKTGVATNYGNIGTIYYDLSDYTKALAFHYKALKINEEIDDKKGIAKDYVNIGNIYYHQKDFNTSIEYYQKALTISEEMGLKNGVAINYGNIGTIYFDKNDYSKSLEYFTKALQMNRELGRKSSIANNLRNIGNIFSKQSDYQKALEYYTEAIKTNEELGNKLAIASVLGDIGEMYLTQVIHSNLLNNDNYTYLYTNRDINLNKATDYINQAINIYSNLGEKKEKSTNYFRLAKAYELKGNYKKAFEAFKEHKQLQDSIFSMDKQKEFATLETKRENELKDAEIVILQTEKKAQKYLFGSGIIISLILFVIAFIRFREKKKLSEKLALQNAEIETQKGIVEEKNEQILASITYASTIQHAILPWGATLSKAFREHFIFFKPKDIVSGDSYWFQEVDGIKFLAVIDCTGHGIPGSMLTVIASSVLDDAVLSKKLLDTAQILTFMNDKVTEVLNQRLAENQIRDGMEVALIAIHQDKFQFSGAGRPLYMKNATFEIIKTDKRGIAGQVENDVYDFSSVEIEKSENMTLYLTTDGFADQMNGDGKKYSTKRFVSLLESISEKPIPEQNIILETEFNSHKGSREQIDDVTVLGVKI